MNSSPYSLLIKAGAMSLLIISLSIGYYFVIYLPQLDNQKLLLEQQNRDSEAKANMTRQQNISNCETSSLETAQSTLKSRVEIMEKTGRTSDPTYQVLKQAAEQDLYNKDDYKELYENCLKKYGL